ncbi:MAG: pyridoxine 5'-phosphate synthase, partial [Merismopediaceae bacterium]|nr:pyridoxine 5'-phosphate synthase [Merismopediaceae bacterium]
MLTLGVNIDHVATVRQARRTVEPDPVTAALLAELGGADGITAHLREDRRHIQDRDVRLLRETVRTHLNLEMATTPEMVAIALALQPNYVTLVPEKREEVTTEGGLDVAGNLERLCAVVDQLQSAGIPVSLFIDAETAQIQASAKTQAQFIELHTGKYADAPTPAHQTQELAALVNGCA